MIKNKMSAFAGIAVLALGLAACGSSSTSSSSSSTASATISGAGSTFAAPVYEQWGSSLSSSGLTVNYQAVGSGASGFCNVVGSCASRSRSSLALIREKWRRHGFTRKRLPSADTATLK